MINIFEKMRKDIHNGSILIISHQERILNIADEIVLIEGGKIKAQGRKDEVLPKLLASSENNCSFLKEKNSHE